MFIDLFIYQYLINISPYIRMASSGTLNERWRLCIEDATSYEDMRSIAR